MPVLPKPWTATRPNRAVTLLLLAAALLTSGLAHPVAAQETVTCARPAAVKDVGREALVTGLGEVIQASAACQTAGDWETWSRLVTENYLGQVYGGGGLLNREDFVAMTADLPVIKVRYRGIDDVKTVRDGEVRANVRTIVGNQLIEEQVTFREEKADSGRWLIDASTPLTPVAPRDHESHELTISGNHFNPNALVATNATIELHIVNQDDVAHEFLLLQLADGATPGQLLLQPGSQLPAGFTYMAQLTLPAKTDGKVVLLTMKPGTYTFVDMLPNAQGIPWLASGMMGTLTITEPKS